jgi:hypothetical protein
MGGAAFAETPMSRPRILRLLRIAFSASCGVVCLLLIVLWLRSYRQVDTLDNLYGYRIDVKRGKLVLGERVQQPSSMPRRPMPPLTRAVIRLLDSIAPTRVVAVASVPIWLPMMLVVSFSVLPWGSTLLRLRRFSLRSLIVATTLVAVVLGLAVAFRYSS